MEFRTWFKETGTSIREAWTAIKSKKKDNESKEKSSVKDNGSTSDSETADFVSSTNSNNSNMESKVIENSESGPSEAVATKLPSASTNNSDIIQDKTSNSTMNLPIIDDLTINPPKANDPTIQSNPNNENSQPNINNPEFTANPQNTNNPTNTNTSNITNNTNVSCTPVTNIKANIVIERAMIEPQQVSGSSRNNEQPQFDPQITLEWVSSNPAYALDLQNRAIVAGKDIDGSDIWVIKTMIESEDRPAKFSTGKREAFVALRSGKEKRIYQFDVCCMPSGKRIPITWKRASDDNFPDNAVTAGETSDGEPFYIGRQLVGRSRCPGMIRPDDKILYLSYGHEVYEYDSYDVLCIS